MQGGMGSRVAEILAAQHPVPIEFVGVQDRSASPAHRKSWSRNIRWASTSIVAAAKRAHARKRTAR